ncbi:MAG: two-component regulator propeller domain-containing protein, partial [Bacteroidota bacterium]
MQAVLVGAQAQVIEFQRIGLPDGLSQLSVMDITQDKFGNVWLGTRNGLNRFDGKRMVTYKTSQNQRSILENQIQQLFNEDSLLWVRSPNSISQFNLHQESFRNYPLKSITAMHVVGDSVWVATPAGLFQFISATQSFEPVPVSLRTNEVITCLSSFQNDLLLGTNQGVWRLGRAGLDLLMRQMKEVKCLFVDSNYFLWVGTNNHGLYQMRDSVVIRHFDGEQDISNDFVRCVEEDEEGRIWVGTFQGLDVISRDGRIAHFDHSKSIPSSLSHNSIWSLFRDRDGAMWVGSYFGGVNIFHPTRRVFTYYPENDQNQQSINFRVVGQVLEDRDRNLWICTDGGGLNYLNRQTGKFTYYQKQPNGKGLSSNNVKCLRWQGDSMLWIGTHRGGLNRLDRNTGIIDHFEVTLPYLDSIRVSEVNSLSWFEDDLLVGTGSDLLRFDLQSETFSHFLPAEQRGEVASSIFSIWKENDQNIWFGTEKSGLFRYNPQTQSLKSFRANRTQPGHLPSDCVYAIYQDHMKRIWIGTSDGLSEYLPAEDRFQSYHKEDGMAGNMVFGIVESLLGSLVIETDKGISYFNSDAQGFRNITFDNGLPLRELRPYGLLNTSDGYLVVSGMEGLVMFNEVDFLNQRPSYYPNVTGLTINQKPVTPSSHPRVIRETIMNAPPIELEHQHSSITFSISDMSFIKSNHQGLEYKLDGFDENWIQAGERSEVTYTNLDDGEYAFFVRSIHAPDFMTSIPLRMSPPFFLSRWAMVLYVLMGIGLILLINYQYFRQSRLAYNLAAEKERHSREEELNQKKINFFTNISHEFRTPLTLMAGQIELLLENANLRPTTYNKLLSIQKHTLRLRNLISELLNFRKLEQGKLELKIKEYDYLVFMREIYASFSELAKHSDIDYSFHADFEQAVLCFDRNQLEKVFYNLLANAFKFTPEGGQIMLNVYEVNDFVYTEIINTGSTIPANMVEKVFDRFYQLDNIENASAQGTGIGLALAKGIVDEHQGIISLNSSYAENTTTFSVGLKKGKQPSEAGTLAPELPMAELIKDHGDLTEASRGYRKSAETILIVEDNPDIMGFLSELLSPLFQIKKAANGADAIELVREDPPDLILSDVLMPKMSGTEMCAKLKSDLLTSHIPIVLLTAKGADEHRIEGLETGADDYIAKPFNAKVLLARINNIFNNCKALQSRYTENPIQFQKKLAKKRIDK